MIKKWRDAYHQHKGNAKIRGVPFLLSFEEWQQIWERSGKWHLRGKGEGKYQMARFFDRGGYEVGNVRIILHETNCRLGHLGEKKSAEHCAKLSAANKGKKLTVEQRAKLSAVHKGKKFSSERRAQISARQIGRKHSTETRAKMALSKIGNQHTLGFKYSAEAREKMSIAAKRRWAKLVNPEPTRWYLHPDGAVSFV
jgi:hypothetical protein